jgi:hypothetical protein
MIKMTFDEWLKAVDTIITAKLGLSRDDLPDCCYRDWYDDGVTPKTAAFRAIRNASE